MPGKHPPGYYGRRYRIQQHILKDYQEKYPDDYAAAWADGETQEHQRKAEKD